MKEWTIDTEEVQKYLDRHQENSYLVESRGYNKDTSMEEIWIFVNDVKDEWLDEDGEMSMRKIYNTSHLFSVEHYLIYVYTSARDEELTEQLKSIYLCTRFSAKGGDGPRHEKAFSEFYKKISKCSAEFVKKSQVLAEKLRVIAIELNNYRSLQTVYSNGELRSQVENMYKDGVDLRSSIEKSYKEIQLKES